MLRVKSIYKIIKSYSKRTSFRSDLTYNKYAGYVIYEINDQSHLFATNGFTLIDIAISSELEKQSLIEIFENNNIPKSKLVKEDALRIIYRQIDSPEQVLNGIIEAVKSEVDYIRIVDKDTQNYSNLQGFVICLPLLEDKMKYRRLSQDTIKLCNFDNSFKMVVKGVYGDLSPINTFRTLSVNSDDSIGDLF